MSQQYLTAMVAVVLSVCAGIASAQQEESTRFPAQGIAILDCAPPASAPAETCLVRVPPLHELVDLQSDPLGATKGEFQLVKPGRVNFPQDLSLAATMVLIDLSPGPNGGRRATFANERAMIAELIERLPASGPVAIYGFNESLTLLSDFTENREDALGVVQSLTLGGTNTRIATFVNDSVSVLGNRSGVLLRNLIVITDGQEEGLGGLDDVIANATERGVVISAVGSFWRPAGAAANGAGMDYLETLTKGTSGAMAQVQLSNRQEAVQRATEFAQILSDAWGASGLIIPVGPAQPSTIRMTLNEPVIGEPGRFVPNNIAATFRPVQADVGTDEAVDEVAQTEPENLLFGFPALYVYAGAAVIFALFALILVLLLRRKSEPALIDPTEDPVPVAPVPPTPVKPAPTPLAYLVFADGNRRAGISGEKISVGRSASNDVVIDADGISRLHAQIYRNREGGYSIADMDSLNGTFVNDTQISGTEKVRLGDTITFGKVTVKLISA